MSKAKSNKGSKSNNSKANQMVDRGMWLQFPVAVVAGEPLTVTMNVPVKVMFYHMPKLSAFTISKDHPAMKGLKATGDVTLLKCGYSSALILNVEGTKGKSMLSKKIIFNVSHEVTPLDTAIGYRPLVIETPVVVADVAAEAQAEVTAKAEANAADVQAEMVTKD